MLSEWERKYRKIPKNVSRIFTTINFAAKLKVFMPKYFALMPKFITNYKFV